MAGVIPTIALGPAPGFDILPDDVVLTAGAAFSKGDVVCITEVDVTTGPMVTARVPTAVDLRYGIAAVALADVASGANGTFRVRGPCQAFTQSAQGTTTIAGFTTYTLRTTKTLDADPPLQIPRKQFALALESSSGAASATKALRWVMMDGVNGFGLDFGSNANSVGQTLAQSLTSPLITASAAYASSSTISTFATTTPGTDDINVSIPSGFMNAAGRAILVTASGTWGATGTPTLTLDVALDSTGATAGTPVQCHTIVGTLTALTGQLWTLQVLVSTKTTGATGTLYSTCTGVKIASATSSNVGAPLTSAAIDLTAAKFLKIRPTWSASSASNTTTMDSLLVQRVG